MAREKSPKRAEKITEDVFASLVYLFLKSSKWTTPPPQGYTASTKACWRRELIAAARAEALGAVSLSLLRPAIIQAYFDGLAGLPGKQRSALGAIRQLDKWALRRDLLTRSITTGIEIDTSDAGHIPWTDEQVIMGETYAPADLSRVITLGANTGQRGSDLVRMGPTDISTYQGFRGINVVQQKTRKKIWVPINSELAAKMETWPRRPGPFLVKSDGRPWTRKSVSNAWTYARDTYPELAPLRLVNLNIEPGWAVRQDRGLVIHGLRGTACVRLKRAGATTPQIADMIGMSVEMVEKYCRFSAQQDNAVAAVLHLEKAFGRRRKPDADSEDVG